jgi:hypothetical protein
VKRFADGQGIKENRIFGGGGQLFLRESKIIVRVRLCTVPETRTSLFLSSLDAEFGAASIGGNSPLFTNDAKFHCLFPPWPGRLPVAVSMMFRVLVALKSFL